ncbi:MAG: transporter substrate-binding domain-containing protein [Campylobacterales bacterium]|nr:transporter substrate-binding domain-containing protein [Campylobacterales bacterium]
MKSPNREDYLNFTNPFLKVPLVLVAKDDKEFIDDLSKLKNKKIAIINQSVFHEILKKRYPNLEIIGVSNGKEGLDLVKDNKVFGYADALHGIRYTKNANLIDGIETIGMFQESYQLAIGVRKDNETLLRVFDKLSSKISEDVKTKTIQKWSALTQKEELEIKEYLEIFLLLVLALIILFFWSLFLKTKVEEEVEKNQANKQLLFQQSKQAALGDMIANIAHQWKQPLNEISMMQSIILKKNEDGTLSKDEIQKQILDEQRVVKFMSKTIQTFQNFYLKKEKEDLFDIKKSYLEVKELLRKTFELHRIQLIEDLEHIKINGDINMFSQVFLSLFQNSIFFFVSRKIQNPKLWITITREKNKILIKIRDNGGGIKAKKISSVFMFNYSDRDNKEKSLGLGLYTSKMIIEEKFDGFITAKNQEDGAVFTIYL